MTSEEEQVLADQDEEFAALIEARDRHRRNAAEARAWVAEQLAAIDIPGLKH